MVFPGYVTCYSLTGSPVEVDVPDGKVGLVVTVSAPIRFAAEGNAGPIPTGGIDDGTGSFHVHPTDALDARTFDVSSLSSLSFIGTGEVGLIWTPTRQAD